MKISDIDRIKCDKEIEDMKTWIPRIEEEMKKSSGSSIDDQLRKKTGQILLDKVKSRIARHEIEKLQEASDD